MNEGIDYTTYSVSPVTTDGAMTQAQRAALPTRSVPSRRRIRERPERTDDRTELEILRGTVEGLLEKTARLEAAVQHLLAQRYPNGIPFDGTRTT
jgi:hypothetical protein